MGVGEQNGARVRAFADSFFGPDDKGQDVLIQRMRAGKHTCEEVLAVLQQRATIEEDYARKLRKLSNLIMGREESGTLKDSLEVVRKELEATSRQRLSLCETMRQDLEKKLAELIVGQATVRKQYQTISEKNIKNKVTQSAVVLKARERYEARCLELQQLMSSRTGLPPKEIEKVRVKIEAGQAAAKKADTEYQQAVAKLKELHTKWEQEWRNACEQFERLENDRLNFMREKLWDYANMYSSVCVAEDEGCERIRVSLEKLNTQSDIQSFIDSNATGSTVPAPLGYINFYTRTSTPYERMDSFSSNVSTQPSVPNLSAQLSALELQGGAPPGPGMPRGREGSADSLGNRPTQPAAAPPPAASSSRTDYKIPVGSDLPPAAAPADAGPAGGQLPRKTSVRRAASVKAPGSASTAASAVQTPAAAYGGAGPQQDAASELQDFEGEEDMYFDYDPFDLSLKKPIICWVRVNYEYHPQAKEELHIRKGMTIPVIQQQEDGWWEGEVEEADGRRRRGLFPSNFASIIPAPSVAL
ncbi:hypothetical protein DFJ74DRAFT_767312 [Hyaloraphidium curvatum]|nr:hypothetical protein DFJ74DRAFT_767312 [Hyaloraphidium curvatum]